MGSIQIVTFKWLLKLVHRKITCIQFLNESIQMQNAILDKVVCSDKLRRNTAELVGMHMVKPFRAWFSFSTLALGGGGGREEEG